MPLTVKGLDEWREGFRNLEPDLRANIEHEWSQETQMFFLRSQQLVHIITGHLKASGTNSTTASVGRVEGRVEYLADYAIYEHARGDTHAWLTRAFEQSSNGFNDALARAWEATVTSWS